MTPVILLRRAFGLLLLSCVFAHLAAQTLEPAHPTSTGAITGAVSNKATGKLLEGALVSIGSLGQTESTDATGRFTFLDVPAGVYTVSASYTGLEDLRTAVTVEAGARLQQNFDLTSSVYQLNKFTVVTDREGNAASITRQRNADSVKSVVSMDAFGNLANDNAGELLIRLPGIAGTHDLDGNISTVSIRGAAANLNMVTVDGNLMASNFGDSRTFALRSISGSLFEEIEVTKAPTPDMPADSIGGAVNFKSASPLDLKGGRHITYGASFRYAPDWVENVPMGHEHSLHPTLKLGWQEVFSVFGGKRNLGVSVNTFYSENADGAYTGTNAYESTLSKKAYLYDYQSRDIYNNRKQKSVSAKVDYRLSPTTTVFVSALVNEDDQPYNRLFIDRAVTTQVLATLDANGNPTGTTGTIYPNYTETFTRVRGLAVSKFILTSQTLGFLDDQLNFNVGAKHKFDRLEVNYDAAYSQSHSLNDTGEHGDRQGGGDIDFQMTGVGWTIDRSASQLYPLFTQTEGPDISNPANYVPQTMSKRYNKKNISMMSAKGDVKYLLPTKLAAYIKVGFNFRSQEMRRLNADRQWTLNGATAGSLASLVNLNKIHTSEEDHIGKQIPFVDAADVWNDIVNNPTHWAENVYYGATRRFIGNDRISEDVLAGFGQGQVIIGKLKILAGARYERTDVQSSGYVASSVLSATAARNADPVAAALADYNNFKRTKGGYGDLYPGVYLTYNLTKNLLFRADWSNSLGRAPLTNLLPTFSVNTTTQVVTTGNPALGPQTSENWDAGVEYYFEPVGMFSANVFRKSMNRFIVTGVGGIIGSGPDNGYNGDYSGYTLNTTFNGGEATIDGYEIAYQQRFDFLPKPFSGLSVFANYTYLKTNGDYGATTARSTTDIVNFIPETINAGLAYTFHGIGARLTWNQTGRYLNAYNDAVAQLRYTRQRTMLDASLSYQIRKSLTAFIDVRNITNSDRSWERAAGITNDYIYFPSVNFGIKGEF